MRKNAISDIINYYANDSNLDQASLEFFGFPLENVDFFKKPEAKILFLEWLVFDFKLVNGKTPIVDFMKNNPLNYSEVDLKIYSELLDNEYGFFSIVSTKPGRVEVESLQQHKSYKVREYSAAKQLLVNQTIICRIAKVGKHYEFISGEIKLIDTKITEQAKEFFRKSTASAKLTPKIVYDVFYNTNNTANDQQYNVDYPMNPKQAEHQAEKSFKECDILPFISVGQVKKWIAETTNEDTTSFPTSIIIGLASYNSREKNLDFLIRAIQDLINYSPHKSLNGKCPFEMRDEVEPNRSSNTPRYITNVIDFKKWVDYAEKAMMANKQGGANLALKNYNNSFKELLLAKTTDREIYCLFANKGATLLVLGNPAGEIFLDMSLQLNPKYDFAVSQLSRLNEGDFDANIKIFLTEKFPNHNKFNDKKFKKMIDKLISEYLENDPGAIYFSWLQKLNIDFSKADFRPTKLITSKVKL